MQMSSNTANILLLFHSQGSGCTPFIIWLNQKNYSFQDITCTMNLCVRLCLKLKPIKVALNSDLCMKRKTASAMAERVRNRSTLVLQCCCENVNGLKVDATNVWFFVFFHQHFTKFFFIIFPTLLSTENYVIIARNQVRKNISFCFDVHIARIEGSYFFMFFTSRLVLTHIL